ncbi:MAG: tRNA (adenosine(37)-N6)-threonylcarbamoyltransferase complex ATPase subunit type 1 TsaE [Candidatus Omnitrophica bacterium]|nr:tRNA (adenosine(37)-N6)-threonylcarbamoyltransferase complex ATPase subunit type 1 TsaE [Candidatus Omnitrophota bacterium]
MAKNQILTQSAEETMALAKRLARHLKGGAIICLYGDLGCGKTTFVKGMASGLKINPTKVNSPTFVLMNIYEGKSPLYHFDFYRLETVDEIGAIGYDEFLYGDGISVIEWAERFGSLLPKEYLSVKFSHKGEGKRLLRFQAKGGKYKELLIKATQSQINKCCFVSM